MFIELLEDRRLFDITITEGEPGFVSIHCTPESETVFIEANQANNTFSFYYENLTRTYEVTFGGYDQLNSISLFGEGGTDTLKIIGMDDPSQSSIGAYIQGGDDSDVIRIENLTAGVSALGGGDTITLVNCPSTDVDAGDGNDSLTLESCVYNPHIALGGGNDTMDAGLFCGGCSISGGLGNDNITGSPHDDVINGNEGNDTLEGLAGNDDLTGGDGFDTMRGGVDNDVIHADDGSADYIDGGPGHDTAYVDSILDTVVGVETIH
jgi:Ca2+-binding RTX toxin-like protein